MSLARLLILAALARALEDEERERSREAALLAPGAEGEGPDGKDEPAPGGLPREVERWKRKELRRYREAQEKKWRNWTEAMFEPLTKEK